MTSPAIPTVSIIVQDNGSPAALSVPLSTVQLKVGIAIGATPYQPYATTSPTSLQSWGNGGDLVEAGGLVCKAGNVCIAMAVPVATKGVAANGGVMLLGSGNTASGATAAVTLDSTYGAWGTYYIKAVCTTAGQVGSSTAPPFVQFSGDAGRNFGSPMRLPATSGSTSQIDLGLPLNTVGPGGTGVRVTFTAGANPMAVGDTFTISTYAPQWSAANVVTALAAFQASQYGILGVGSAHLVGDAMHAAFSGGTTAPDVATIQAQLQAGVAIYEYQRAILELGDTLNAGGVPYSGTTSETEAAWISRIAAITPGITAPRVTVDDGYYNMPTAYPNAAFGTPSYRRNLAWAHAVRRTQIPIQRRAGRVKDGPLAPITVNPATDPTDGFVYHDERIVQGLNAANVGSAMTWPKKGAGFFQCQEPLLCAPGSQFVELAIGNVLDAACDIAYAVGVEEVSDDLTVTPAGTLDPTEAAVLQSDIQVALVQGLVQTSYVSSVGALVNTTNNVLQSGNILINVSVVPKAYANAITETISLVNGR